jgi:PIN domain nuclease of toxin-antitoxin system
MLWYAAGDSALSGSAREIIENPDDLCFVSTAALWEIASKHSIGKLQLNPSFARLIPQIVRANNFQVLPISLQHTSQVATLPFPGSGHRDPFDRLMIAQAIVEGLPIVSNDGRFDSYPIQRVW